ncbi:hypothetical protein Fcan01_27770 [Folsomia candida]|uniref:F-box domain-containing protein n=1 Tax=Folsomia candida TaxID=158441 RepID=A0A226CWX6_FOLCA|nr:hypothetical protein Fcan01_27770 [Folsomia candida]
MEIYLPKIDILRRRTQNDGNNSSISSLFNNSLVLRKIFSFLDFITRKNIRLVCKHWAFEVAKQFSGKISLSIEANKIKNDPTLEKLASFLSHHNIRHTLKLIIVRNEGNYEHQHKDLFKYLEITRTLVVELVLNLYIGTEKDADLLIKIVHPLIQLNTLCLHLQSHEGVTLPVINSPVPFYSVKNLALSVEKPQVTVQDCKIRFAKWIQALFRNFPSVTDADLTNRVSLQGKMIRQHRYLQECFLEALVTENSNHPIKLTGIKLDLRCRPNSEWNLISAIPQSLKRIIVWVGADLEKTGRFLTQHSSTLKELHVLFVQFAGLPPLLENPYRLLPNLCLPQLTTLRFDSYYKVDNLRGERPGRMDLLGLREIFLNGSSAFEAAFPALTSLTIVFFTEFSEECWDYIFPDEDKFGIPLEIRQLKILSITMATDCDSSLIWDDKLPEFTELPCVRSCRQVWQAWPLVGCLWCFLIGCARLLTCCCCCERCCNCEYQASPVEIVDPPIATLRGCEHNFRVGEKRLPFPASDFLRPLPCIFFEEKQLHWSNSYHAAVRPIWE